MKLYWIALVTALHVSPLRAQTESQPDTVRRYHTLRMAANGSMNITPADRVQLFTNQLIYAYSRDRLEFNSNSKWIYGSNLAGLTNNDFIGLVDGNYFHDSEKRLNSWILGSYTSSFSLNIFNEYQAGAGVAYKVLDDRKNGFISLKLSNGFIWEESNFLNPEGVRDNYSIIRNSLRVQLKLFLLQRKISLESTTYWQPALNKAGDYNLRTANVLNIPVWQFFSLQTRWEYNYIARTEKENTLFNYGISARFTF